MMVLFRNIDREFTRKPVASDSLSLYGYECYLVRVPDGFLQALDPHHR